MTAFIAYSHVPQQSADVRFQLREAAVKFQDRSALFYRFALLGTRHQRYEELRDIVVLLAQHQELLI